MDLTSILFYVFAVIVIGSAAVVAFSKNIMYAAFSLLFTLFGVAAFYVLLNADFLAVTQIMVYIGGILVLIIFGVMLTTRITGIEIKSGLTGKMHRIFGALAGIVLAVTLSVMYSNVQWFTKPVSQDQLPDGTISLIGVELLTEYILAFEVASVVLLIAIVGAALIARRK